MRCLDISCNQMEGVIGAEISSLQFLEVFNANDNLVSYISFLCFLIPALKQCDIRRNPNLKDPPVYEAEAGV